MKRRTEILVEIEREITISTSGSNRSRCLTCSKPVQMISVSEAAQIVKTDESVIYMFTESGELHFATSNDGKVLICSDSLLTLWNDENARPIPKLQITEGEVLAD